jgi:hypothetical protein
MAKPDANTNELLASINNIESLITEISNNTKSGELT